MEYGNNKMLTSQCNVGLSISAKQPSSTRNTKHRIQSSFAPNTHCERWLWETEQKEHSTTHIYLALFEAVTL